MSHLGRIPGTALLAAACVAASLACGHRGDPLPPLRHTPPGLAEFRLAQRGDALEVFAAGAVGFGRRHRLRAAGRGDPVRGRTEGPREGGREARGAGVRTTARGRDAAAARAGDDRARLRARHRRPREGAANAHDGAARPGPGRRTARAARAARRRRRAPRVGGGRSEAGVRRPCCRRVRRAFRDPPWAPTAARWPPARPRRPHSAAPHGRRPRRRRPRPRAGADPGATRSKATTVEVRTAGFLVYRRVGTESYRLPLGQEPLVEPRTTDTTAPQGASACYVVRAAASRRPARRERAVERGLPRGARHRGARGAHGRGRAAPRARPRGAVDAVARGRPRGLPRLSRGARASRAAASPRSRRRARRGSTPARGPGSSTSTTSRRSTAPATRARGRQAVEASLP